MAEKKQKIVYQLFDVLPGFSVGGVQNYVSDLFGGEEFSEFAFFSEGNANPDKPYNLSQVLFSADSVVFAAGEPDVLHIHQIMPYGLLQLIRLAGKYPTVLSLHDYFLFCQRTHFYSPDYKCAGFSPENLLRCTDKNCAECLSRGRCRFPYRLFLYFRKILVGILFKKVTAITLPNPDLLRLVPTEQHHKCHIIPYAIKKSVNGIQHKNARNYVYLGHMVPHKGIFQLISELEREDFKEELHIFGPLPKPEILQTLPKFVRHQGLIKDYAVLSEYKALLVPSLWRETGPLVLQEGLRAGIPVFVRRGAVADFYLYDEVYEFSVIKELLNINKDFVKPDLPDLAEVRQTFFRLYSGLCDGRRNL